MNKATGIRSSIITLAAHESRKLWSSAAAYFVLVFVLLCSAVWFFLLHNFFARDVASLRSYFAILPILYAIAIPAAGMHIWVQEFRSGTFELLVSFPVTEWDLVIGKFLGIMSVVFTLVLLSVLVPLSVLPFGHFDIGQIFSEYFGIVLIGMSFAAFVCFVGAVWRSQISAFLVSTLFLLGISVAGYVVSYVELPDALAAIIRYVSFYQRYTAFMKGIIDSRDVLYFVFFSFSALFANRLVLLFRRWQS